MAIKIKGQRGEDGQIQLFYDIDAIHNEEYNKLQQTVQNLAARIDDLDVADEEEY